MSDEKACFEENKIESYCPLTKTHCVRSHCMWFVHHPIMDDLGGCAVPKIYSELARLRNIYEQYESIKFERERKKDNDSRRTN